MPSSDKSPRPMAWVEIDLAAVRHNFRHIRTLAFDQLEPKINRSVDILSVVKADAYGHGMVEVSRVIEKEGGRFFAVSNLGEAIELRESGNKRRIILFETTLPEMAPFLVKYDLTPGVCTMDLAVELDKRARRSRKVLPIHVKIDTGMGRLGVWHEQAPAFIKELCRLKNLRVEGVFTHCPVADTDKKYTESQFDIFSHLVAELIKAQVPFRYLHMANSMGVAAYKNRFFNLARPGVMLYGLYPAENAHRMIDLRPVMSLKARVLLTKTIQAGRGISYGHTFKADKDLSVAVISIGYSDGYRRSMSNKARVLINGVSCPVVGRVTMDQTIVDISNAGTVEHGDEVVLIGRQGEAEITTDELADWAGTINYEVVCNLGNRLPRVFKNA